MVHRADLAEVGEAAHRPQPPRLVPTLSGEGRILGDELEDGEVDRFGRRAEERVVALRFEAPDQHFDVGEIELGIAPVEEVERAEAVVLDRFDLGFGESRALFGAEAERAEAAVLLVTTRSPGDLGHFGDGQAAVAAPVEFLEPREGDMADVHVEAHADGVRGDQIIDLAALEHRDLGIAGRRREDAHDHRGAALEPPKHLGQRVDLLGGEGDDRRPWRKPRELDAAAVA